MHLLTDGASVLCRERAEEDESSGCVSHVCTVNAETCTDIWTSCATCRGFAVHMKLFSTGLVRRTWCGSLPLLEPREFIVTSSTGFPRCSVSSRQSHELRTCSPLTELGVCGHRSQTHVLQFVFSSNAQNFFGELQESVRGCSCDASHQNY